MLLASMTSAVVAVGHDDLMSSPVWGSPPVTAGCSRPVFGLPKPKVGVTGFPRPGADFREQAPMAVEMAVVTHGWRQLRQAQIHQFRSVLAVG